MIQGLNADVPVKILTFNRTSAYVLKDIFFTELDDWALKVGWEGSKIFGGDVNYECPQS